MLKSKRAQREGAAVAILIIVIALFMTFYILFIPPEERSKLLQQDTTSTETGTSTPAKIELLAESPGLVTPTTESATIHRIPSVNVFLKDEPKIISLAQSLVVSKGLFSRSTPQLKFQTKVLDETTKSFLKQDNSLELSVSSPGFAFWSVNKYSLKELGVKQEFERKNNEESRAFVMSSEEKNNLKSVKLKYTQQCN